MSIAIPEMETQKMEITTGSSVIGVNPRPEIRGTGWRKASREIFGEDSIQQSD